MIRHLFLSTLLMLLGYYTTFAENAKLQGIITNPIADEIEVSYFANYLNYQKQVFKAKLGSDGSFSINMPVLPFYSQLQIQHGNQATEIFIKPGDELTMTVDAKDFDKTLKYTGKGAVEANFMAKHMLEKGFLIDFTKGKGPLYKLEMEAFKLRMKVLFQEEMDFLEKNKTGLPKAFVKQYTAWYQYTMYNDMLDYSFKHRNPGDTEIIPKTDRSNYKIAKDVPEIFSDEYLGLSSYAWYAAFSYGTRFSAQIGNTTYKNPEERGSAYDAYVKKQVEEKMPFKTREYYYAYHIYYNASNGSSSDKVDKQYEHFKKQFTTNQYDSIIDKSVGIKRKIGKGLPAIDFTFTTLDDKQMKLSDLKGKVVYLDFWGTWCAPCIEHLPYAKKVKEHFKDKDVVFLNVALGTEKDALKKFVEMLKIGGVHAVDEDASKLYGVNGVPIYYLIDRNGMFATEDTPSPKETEELTRQIEALLN